MIAVAPTDKDWFESLREIQPSGHVNFWTPTPWNLTRLKPAQPRGGRPTYPVVHLARLRRPSPGSRSEVSRRKDAFLATGGQGSLGCCMIEPPR